MCTLDIFHEIIQIWLNYNLQYTTLNSFEYHSFHSYRNKQKISDWYANHNDNPHVPPQMEFWSILDHSKGFGQFQLIPSKIKNFVEM